VIAAAPPPALVGQAPIPSRNVMVWGDRAAMDAMQKAFVAKGWRWLTLVLGNVTPALMLIPPATVTDEEITTLVTDVNAGKFGKLNGGYGSLGEPDKQSGSTLN
jgi:hypothetical protein